MTHNEAALNFSLSRAVPTVTPSDESGLLPVNHRSSSSGEGSTRTAERVENAKKASGILDRTGVSSSYYNSRVVVV